MESQEGNSLSPLNKFYLKISDNLKEDQVKSLRDLLAHDNYIAKGKIQNKTPHEIFNMLEADGKIGEGNLRLLKDVLRSLNETRLAEEAEDLERDESMAMSKTSKRKAPEEASSSKEPKMSRDDEDSDDSDSSAESGIGSSPPQDTGTLDYESGGNLMTSAEGTTFETVGDVRKRIDHLKPQIATLDPNNISEKEAKACQELSRSVNILKEQSKGELKMDITLHDTEAQNGFQEKCETGMLHQKIGKEVKQIMQSSNDVDNVEPDIKVEFTSNTGRRATIKATAPNVRLADSCKLDKDSAVRQLFKYLVANRQGLRPIFRYLNSFDVQVVDVSYGSIDFICLCLTPESEVRLQEEYDGKNLQAQVQEVISSLAILTEFGIGSISLAVDLKFADEASKATNSTLQICNWGGSAEASSPWTDLTSTMEDQDGIGATGQPWWSRWQWWTGTRHKSITQILSPVDTQDFFKAAEGGDLQAINRGLNAGVDPNVRKKLWRLKSLFALDVTALHVSAFNGQLKVTEALIEHGADINARDQYGGTPLHFAADRGFTNICEILINHGADIDARNKMGNTPLHLACGATFPDGDLVDLLIRNGANLLICNDKQERPLDVLSANRNHWTDEYVRLHVERETTKQANYSELVGLLGTEEETTVKVAVSGFGQAGKTCLATALRMGRVGVSEIKSDVKNVLRMGKFNPTPGVNISSRVVPGIGRIGLFDFAGQTEFYVTHAMLLRTTNSIFPLVYNITDEVKTQNFQVHTWLSLIKRSNAEVTNKPRVILIASHSDMLKTTEEKNQGKLRAEEMVKHHRDLFKASLLISKEVFLMDCRSATSPEMDRLRQMLAAIKEDMLRERKPVPKLCAKLTSQLPSWLEKKGKFPVMTWEEYLSAGRVISDGLTERVAQLATSYLHHDRKVIYLRGNAPKVVLDSQWLCSSVIGPLMARDNFPIVKINPTEDDLVTREEINRVFGEVADIPMLIQLLQALQLCHPYDENRFIFPTRLEKEMPTAEWAKTDKMKPIYFGRQIRCRDKTDEFSCDFFPRVQTQLLKRQKHLIGKPIIWKNSIKCVDAHADALVQYTIEQKMVNIIVRSESVQREYCRTIMRMIKNIVYTTLQETSPGIRHVEEVLSAYALKEHLGCYTYSAEQVQHAAKHDGVVYHNELKKWELLQDLFIDAPNMDGAAAPPSRFSAGRDSDPTSLTPPSSTDPPTQGAEGPVILLINDEYGTSKGGISTVNCQAGQILQGKAVVYATTLRVPKQDQEVADRDGVTLIGPVQLDKESVPTLDWLTKDHSIYFPNLPQDVTCIIGHADITDTAAKNIKALRFPQADLITFTHVLPEDTEYYKGGRKAMKAWEKERDMLDKVDNAKAVFSVGKRIYDYFCNKYMVGKKPQSHHIFLPKPSKLFLDTNVRPGGEQKVVLSIGRVRKVEKLKGHDLAGQALREVVKIIKNARLRVRGIDEDDWENSQKILEDALNSPDLNPTLLPYGTQADVRDDMRMAHLVLMPSRSEPFGLVGLEAIAAGIPVLISDKTGLAEMINDLIKKKKLSAEHRNVIVETSVNDRFCASDLERWTKRIVDVLKHSDSEFEKAARFKLELVESRYWEESHNTFLQACGITTAAANQLRSTDNSGRGDRSNGSDKLGKDSEKTNLEKTQKQGDTRYKSSKEKTLRTQGTTADNY